MGFAAEIIGLIDLTVQVIGALIPENNTCFKNTESND